MKSPFLTSIRRLLFVDRDSLFIKSIVDGDVQTAEHFIRTGSIDINCQSFKYKEVRGWAAFHFAAKNGNNEILELLVKYGANINIEDTCKSQTPLLVAIENEATLMTITQLVNSGASVDILDHNGDTVLHYAARRGCKTITHYFLQDVDTILNINAQNKLGESCLHVAIYRRHYNLVQLLLQNKVDVKLIDQKGKTAIHYAVELGWAEILHMMLMKAAIPLNIQDSEGKSLLHTAIEYNQPLIVKLLMQFGASKEIADKRGWKAIDYAERYGCQQMLLSRCELSLSTKEDSTVTQADEGNTTMTDSRITHTMPAPLEETIITTPTTDTTVSTPNPTTSNTPIPPPIRVLPSILLAAIDRVDEEYTAEEHGRRELVWSEGILYQVLTLLSVLACHRKIIYDYGAWCTILQSLLADHYPPESSMITTIATHYHTLRAHTMSAEQQPLQPGDMFNIHVYQPHSVTAAVSKELWFTLDCLVTNSFWTFLATNNTHTTNSSTLLSSVPSAADMIQSMSFTSSNISSSCYTGGTDGCASTSSSSSDSSSLNTVFSYLPPIPCYFPGYEKEYFLSLAILCTIITSGELRVQPKRVVLTSIAAGFAAYYIPGACESFTNAVATVECLAKGIDNAVQNHVVATDTDSLMTNNLVEESTLSRKDHSSKVTVSEKPPELRKVGRSRSNSSIITTTTATSSKKHKIQRFRFFGKQEQDK